MWSLTLLPFIVGLVAASNHHGFKNNTKYEYELSGRNLIGLNEIADDYDGIIFKCKLTLQAKGDGVSLIGRISDAHYTMAFETVIDLFEIPAVAPKPYSIKWSEKPFEVVQHNGVVKDLIVDEEVSSWEVNLLKGIVSLLQVDTQGENLMQSTITQLPEVGRSSGVYKTVEDTVSGIFETLYEVNPLPDYKLQLEPDLVPLKELQADGEIIEIVKTKNFSNAAESAGYYYGLGEMGRVEPLSNQLGDLISRDSISRIVLTGNLETYTIQSSVTVNKIAVSPMLVNNNQKGLVTSVMNMTLFNVQQSSEQLQGPPKPVSLGDLVYSYEQPSTREYTKHKHPKKNWRDKMSSYNFDSSEEKDQSKPSSESVEDILEMQQQTASELNEPPNAPLLRFYVGYRGKSIKTAPEVNVVENATQIAIDIGRETRRPRDIPHEDTLSKYTILSALIRIMNLNEIEMVIRNVYSEDEYTDKIQAWKAFRDALAEAGTGPALLAIQNLILNGKIKNEEAAEVVSGMAQSVREPTYDYVKSFYDFILKPEIRMHGQLNVTSLLRFSELVNNVYINKGYSHREYPVHSFGSFNNKDGRKLVLNQYIPFLSKELSKAVYEGDSHKIHVYISALGNTGHPQILRVFKPYLEGQHKVSQAQRLLIVNCLEALVRNYPKIAQNLLYKIYQNPGERSDVRIAAVYQLVRTRPSTTMLQRIADYSNIDQDHQVNSAVKSIILHAADLKGSQYAYKRTSARSTKPFLSNREYGPQYSHNHKEAYYGHDKTTLQYIASPDYYLPKALRLAYRSNFGGSSRQHASFQYSASSVKDLVRVIAEQFQEHWDDMQKQKAQSSEGADYRFSAENIIRMLSLQVDEQEQAEESIWFKLGGYKRWLTIDNHTLEALPQMVKEIQEILKQRKLFDFTKFFNADQIAVSFPTDMGLPFLYTYDIPTLLSLTGNVKADAEFSTGSKLKLPATISSEGEINFLVSYKVLGQFGFISPVHHRHFMSGCEKTGQMYVPINHKLYIDVAKREIKTEFGFQKIDRNTSLLSYESVLYVGAHNILELKPSLVDVRHVGPYPKANMDLDFGRSTGMLFRLRYEGDDKLLDWGYLYEQVQKNNFGGVVSFWENQPITNTKLNLYYAGDVASNTVIKADVVCLTKYYNEVNEKTFDEKFLYQPTKDVVERMDEFVELTAGNITGAKAFGLGADIKFEGSRPVEYRSTLTYARSKANILSRALLHVHKQTKTPEIKDFYVFTWAENQHIPVSELDAHAVLMSDVSSKTQARFGFGGNETTKVSMIAYLNASRTNDRVRFFSDKKLYRQCRNEVSEGNKQLHACQIIRRQATYPDEILFQVNGDKKCVADQIYNWLRYQQYIGPEDMEGFNSKPDDFYAEVYFSPDFAEFNVTAGTSNYGSHNLIRLYDNEDLQEDLRENPVAYWLSALFSESYNRPNCVVDKTAINTFDNFTYYFTKWDSSWKVVMVYTPSRARDQQPLSEHLKSHNNYAILTRELPSGRREIKIYLRTIETQGKTVIIDFKPDSADVLPEVYVNDKQYNCSYGIMNRLLDGYVEFYKIPKRPEIKLDVKGEFSVVFNGLRLKILLSSDRFYNDIRGLCGNSNSNSADEFRAPQNCAVRTSDEFVDAYTITDDVTPDSPKQYHYKYGCYNYSNVFANVVSNKDAGIDSENYSMSNKDCLNVQTRYQVKSDQVCFTTRPLPRCRAECKPLKTIAKIVDVHCVNKGFMSRMWIAQIDKGANPDFSLKSPTKGVRFDLQPVCSQN